MSLSVDNALIYQLVPRPQTTKIKSISWKKLAPCSLRANDKLHTLADRMRHYKVPAVSMALIDKGEIAWVKSWGIKENGKSEPVTPNTLFQAASISKPVSSVAALRMVASGELSLDNPLITTCNAGNYRKMILPNRCL